MIGLEFLGVSVTRSLRSLAFAAFAISTLGLMAAVPQTANPTVSLRQNGWAVNPHTGALSLGLPLGTVPGEIPIPVNFGIQGYFSKERVNRSVAHYFYNLDGTRRVTGYTTTITDVVRPAFGTIHFGFIRNAWNAPDNGTEPSITLLEDGQEYDGVVPFSTAHAGVGLALPQAYGFAAPASPMVDDSSRHLSYDTSASGLGQTASALLNQHLPVGLGTASATYKVVMDQSIARVFVSAPVLGGWVPVLWLDRFGHYVTFDWNRATSGLPGGASAMTSVIARNSRGRGVEVRWADWTDTTTVHDLVRVDFLNMSAPSMLVQGLSGVTSAAPSGFTWGYAAPANGTQIAPPSSTGGPVGRPTMVLMGDPNSVPQPVWTNAGPVPAIQPQTIAATGPSTANQAWSLNWDANNASVTSLTSPAHVTSAFTAYANYDGPYDVSPNSTDSLTITTGTSAYGVTQVDESDGSGATHRVSWARTPTTTLSPTSVTIQDYWPSAGSADREWILTYDAGGVSSGNDAPNKTVLADASGNPLVTSTPSLTTAGVNGSSVAATQVIAAYAAGLGRPDTKTVQAFVDASNLQLQQAASFVAPNGSTSFVQTQQVQNTFTPRWDMLDAGEVTMSATTRYDATGASALSPTVTKSNIYDTPASGAPALLQLVKTYQQIGNWQHGASFGYDSEGRPASQAVYDSPDAGTTVNASPQTVTLGYDSASGSPASAATSYTIPGSSASGSTSQSQRGFDPNGRPTQMTDAKGVTATVTYDLLGRIASMAQAGQAALSISWSGDNRTRTLVQNGQTETDAYDGFGRLLSQSLPDGRQVSFTFDQDGRKATQKELAGAQTNPATGQPYPPGTPPGSTTRSTA